MELVAGSSLPDAPTASSSRSLSVALLAEALFSTLPLSQSSKTNPSANDGTLLFKSKAVIKILEAMLITFLTTV